MKRVFLLLVAAAVWAGAQEAQPMQQQAEPEVASTKQMERPQAPSYSDLYCAGFMRQQPIAPANYVAAGLNSPNTTHFAERDMLFIEGGGLQEGTVLSVVRELRDPNRSEAFVGQHAALRAAGESYADLGRLRVVTVRGTTAIARVEFSCNSIVPGDLVIPFEERAVLPPRGTVPFERFPAEASGPTGRIIMARDFDTVVGTGHKVYLNLGSDQGIKAGDYFRIVRSYDPDQLHEVERLSYKAPESEDTQKRLRKLSKQEYQNLPRRAVGQLMVLMANPGSATAMVTVALESISVGDTVELESLPASQ